jgi:hypothetical protein
VVDRGADPVLVFKNESSTKKNNKA